MSTSVKFVRSLRNDIKSFKNKKHNLGSCDSQKFIWPFHLLKHPYAAISSIKYENKGSALVACIVLLLYFLTNILRFFNTGFIFNMNNKDTFNIVMQLLSSVILVVLWAVANWSVSTLMDGEGKFHDIWVVSCFAVMPKIITNIVIVILSNVMIYSENIFLTTIDYIGTLWMVFLIILGVIIIHQFSLLKAIGCCLITVFGILAILFMVILFISIVQQMLGFVNTVSVELLNRY